MSRSHTKKGSKAMAMDHISTTTCLALSELTIVCVRQSTPPPTTSLHTTRPKKAKRKHKAVLPHFLPDAMVPSIVKSVLPSFLSYAMVPSIVKSVLPSFLS